MRRSRARGTSFASVACFVSTVLLIGSCRVDRNSIEAINYEDHVAAILAARCKDCHGASAKAAGAYSVETYLSSIACTQQGEVVVMPRDERAPILRALDKAPHQGLLSEEERKTLVSWIEGGAPKGSRGAHPEGFSNPRAANHHGALLRAEQWKPMLDVASAQSCGRCHDGTPSGAPKGVTMPAPNAPACTTCHTEPAGPLACNTCHGDGARSAPPRSTCFFPEDARTAGAHAAHVAPGNGRSATLPCRTCHTEPALGVFDAAHGNGKVEVAFDPIRSGDAVWDAASRSCTTKCHARAGGNTPTPLWDTKGEAACNSCHGAPPPAHYQDACTSCHQEANAMGTALQGARLHGNGVVDLGDGSKQCGSCHGLGDNPWPSSGLHAQHRSPKNAAPVACDNCHTVPTTHGAGTSHPQGGGAKVVFSGLANQRGAGARYENGTCSNVYCHGAGVVGTTAKSLRWELTQTPASCTECHAMPPGAPHFASTSCWTCHPSVTDPSPNGAVITVPSRHINGLTDR